MKRVMVDCNTCNTENFGIDTPHRIKTDALRTGGQQWIMECEILSK